jgi:hypothetical protein
MLNIARWVQCSHAQRQILTTSFTPVDSTLAAIALHCRENADMIQLYKALRAIGAEFSNKRYNKN